ncbi:uncharacterized protein LOC113764442 isoform X5 [Coffea eugenioides]|uniref:uncharacterized protein LOC113764442 isoform X5 n=1 Tax=Coffea eugenioides TaxID=49369 RepID=UPI000F605259|nr:uncharacterized protein LOC113764442 isoform X5 [Coffea eugenioides]
MEVVAKLPEILSVFESSLSQIKWKLRPSAKRRLETDVLALITEMRPVVMVDYGGKMPELQEQLCSFLDSCQKESPVFELLKVMVIEDMIYFIHARALAEFVKSSLNLETEVVLIDVEQDPPKMMAQNYKSSAAAEFLSIQKKFYSLFHSNPVKRDLLQCEGTETRTGTGTSNSTGVIDLSSWIQETEVTIPAINGSGIPSRGAQCEELMSFTVPYDLSLEGRNEPWAKSFLLRMQAKLETCKQVWGSLKMEVSGCYPQAIVL